MKYYRIVTSTTVDETKPVFGVSSKIMLKEFKNDSECTVFVLDELKKGYEYIDIQPITENIYKRSEVKSMNDYSFGVREQKRYTKKEEWMKTTDFIRSYLVR